MRIQILNLPSVVVGDDVQEPFALVFDQADDSINKELWASFAHLCGAKNHIIVPQTVEVVDRYAEPAAAEPVPGNVEALRELHRLAEYVHDNFRDDAAEGGGTIVDVAIRLLSLHLIRKDVVDLKERMDRVGSGQISWGPNAVPGTTVTNDGQDVAEPAPGEPAEIASLPPEVRTLIHAVDRMRDNWAEADVHVRYELWMAVHDASDAVYQAYRESPIANLTTGWPRIGPQTRATMKRPPDYLGPNGEEGWL